MSFCPVMPLARSAPDSERAQRDDERHQAETDNQQAVHRTGERGDRHSGKNGQNRQYVWPLINQVTGLLRGIGRCAGNRQIQHPCHHDDSECNDRANRQIDSTGNNHERHAQGSRRVDGALSQDAFQVPRRVELPVFDRERKKSENHEQHDKPANRVDPARLPDRRTGRIGAIAVGCSCRHAEALSSLPVAASMSWCSFHCATGRVGPSRPRVMTAISSHTPSSSGR